MKKILAVLGAFGATFLLVFLISVFAPRPSPQDIARREEAHRNLIEKNKAYLAKLKNNDKLLAAVGVEQYGYEGNNCYFRVGWGWRSLPVSQKEQFLTMMLKSWRQANGDQGWVEIQDRGTGRVIAKLDSWGLKIYE